MKLLFHFFEIAHLVNLVIKNNLPSINKDHSTAKILHFLQNVRRQQNCFGFSKVPDQLPDADKLIRIETAGRFVENENIRVVQERLGHSHTLAKASRQFADRFIPDFFQVAFFSNVAQSLFHMTAFQPTSLPKIMQCTPGSHLVVQPARFPASSRCVHWPLCGRPVYRAPQF